MKKVIEKRKENQLSQSNMNKSLEKERKTTKPAEIKRGSYLERNIMYFR